LFRWVDRKFVDVNVFWLVNGKVDNASDGVWGDANLGVKLFHAGFGVFVGDRVQQFSIDRRQVLADGANICAFLRAFHPYDFH